MKLFKTQVSRCPIKSNLDKTDWAQEDFGWAEEKLRGVWVSFCLTIWRGRPITHLQIPRSCQKRHKPNKWLTLTISFCSASCGFIHDEAHTSLKRRFLVGKSSWEHDFSEKSWLILCSFYWNTSIFMLFWERPKINKHKCMIPAPKWMPRFENIFKKRMLLYSTIWALIFLLQKKQDRYIRR